MTVVEVDKTIWRIPEDMLRKLILKLLQWEITDIDIHRTR